MTKVWIQIKTPSGIKKAGYVQNRIFYVPRKEKYVYYKYEGIGFNKELIDKFVTYGHINIVKVQLSNRWYDLTPQEIKEKGIVIDNKGEKQYLIPLSYLKQKGGLKNDDN